MVKLDEIKSALSRLRDLVNEQSSLIDTNCFREQLNKAYQQRILSELSILFDQHGHDLTPLRSALTNYLRLNEALIHGSAFYYTCTPQDPVTKLLCLVAEWISATSPKDNPVSAMSILMPSLDLVPKYTIKYPVLCVEKDNSSDYLSPEELETHSRLHRIRQTKITEEEKKQLANLTARLEQSSSHEEHCNIIEGWRIPKVRLNRVLTSHILSEDGLSLIPISLASEDDPINPYSATYAKLTPDEIQRIKNHSITTGCFFAVKDNLERLRHDDVHLLAQLSTLLKRLSLNDAHGGIGQQKSAASGGYTAIIDFNDYYRDLSEVEKDTIPAEVKAEIELLLTLASDATKNVDATKTMATCIGSRGESLSRVIKKHENALFLIRRTAAQNEDALTNAKEIQDAHRHLLESSLSNGSYSGQDRLPYRATLLKSFDITFSIKTRQDFYRFMDLSTDDMEELSQIEPVREAMKNTIIDPNEFAAFVRATPDIKLKTYFKIVGTHRLLALDCLQKVKLVFFEISANKIRLVMGSEFSKHYLAGMFFSDIHPVTQLGRFLSIFDVHQCKVICESLREHFPGILYAAEKKWDYYALFSYLTPDQSSILWDILVSKVGAVDNSSSGAMCRGLSIDYYNPFTPRDVGRAGLNLNCQPTPGFLIYTVEDLKFYLSRLSPTQCVDLCRLLKNELLMMVESSFEVSALLESLTPLVRSTIYQIIKYKLLHILLNDKSGGMVLKYLTPDDRTDVFESIIRPKLNVIIKDADTLHGFCLYLTDSQRAEVYYLLKNKLGHWISRGSDFGLVLCHVTPLAKFREVCESFKEKLLGFSKTFEAFGRVLEHLTPDQCRVVCELCKASLSTIRVSKHDLASLLLHLPEETNQNQIEVVCHFFADDFLRVIQSCSDFQTITYSSPYYPGGEKKISVVYELIKGQLPGMINTMEECRMTLNILNMKQRAEMSEFMKERLPAMIESLNDLAWALEPIKSGSLYDALKEKFINLVHSRKTLVVALSHFGSKNPALLLSESLKIKLPMIVKTSDDFHCVMQQITPLWRHDIAYQVMVDVIPNLIQSADDLIKILGYLSPSQCKAVCDSLDTKWSKLIKTGGVLYKILSRLNLGQREAVYQSIEKQLLILIKISTIKDLGCVVKLLPPAGYRSIFDTLNDQMTDIVKSTNDLVQLLGFLTQEQFIYFLNTIKTHLPIMIKADENLAYLLTFLSDHKRIAFCIAMSETPTLLDRFKSSYDLNNLLSGLSPELIPVMMVALKAQLPKIIRTGRDLGLALNYLIPKECSKVLEFIQTNFPDMIQSSDDLGRCLQPIRRMDCYWNVLNELPSTLWATAVLFSTVLSHLSLKQTVVVCDILKIHLQTTIQTTDDLEQLLLKLTPDQCRVVCQSLEHKLPDIINTSVDLAIVLRDLSPEQCEVVCMLMNAELPRMVNAGFNLGKVLKYLSPEKCAAVCAALKPQLPNMIKTCRDLFLVFDYLTSERLAVVYEAIQWHIPSLLESGDDLEPLLDRLPFRERDELIDSLKINTAGLFAKAVAKFKRHQLSDQIPSDAINALIDELSEKASDILSGEQRNVIKSVFFVKISTSLSEIAKKHFPRHHRLVYSVFLDTLLEFIPNDPVHVSTPHASSMAFFSEGSYQNEACEPSYKHTVKHRAFC